MTRAKNPTWSPPHELGEYRIVRALGAGAMGKVFLAHDTLLDRPVAIKFLSARDLDGVARDRFLIEARALARLQHPNVVAVYRVGELGRRPYLVSEFVRGESLDKLAKPLPWRRVLELAIGLVRGLAAAHRRGVLHRDIKPANSILTDDGEVKLLDFGLAKFTDRPIVAAPAASAQAAPPPAVGASTVALGAAPGSESTVAVREVPGTATDAAATAPLASDAGDSTTVAGVAPVDPPGDGDRNATLPLPDGAVVSPLGGSPGREGSLTRAGALMGTPYYMAPEVWSGEPASERSDVYSLGVLLYELLAGKPPYLAPTLAELAFVIGEGNAAPLADAAPGVDPGLAAIVERCLRREAHDRHGSADALCAELEALAAPAPRIPEFDGDPYPGLRPFDAGHAAVFFGRDAELRAIIDRLRTEGLVVVTGEPGVGKSSLCLAGVGPAVEAGALGEKRSWQVAAMIPGRRPRIALAAALAATTGLDGDAIERALASPAGAALSELRHDVLRRLGTERGALLVVDQLEELVTIADPEEAATVAGFLVDLLATRAAGVRVIATVRGDYLARAATLDGLGERLSHALFVLHPMASDAARRAIVAPAASRQVTFASDAVVDELVGATRALGLPLVQFALAELWSARRDGVIDATALAELGGVVGALTRRADHVFLGLPDAERAAAARILTALVREDHARIQRTRAELLAVGGAAAERALEALIKGRLIVARAGDPPSYEIVHDALIARWDRLRGWLDDDGEQRIVLRRIAAAAEDWARHGRSAELLWRDRRVREAERVPERHVEGVGRAFLAASRAAVRRKRAGRLAIAIGVPLAIAAAVVGVRMRIAAAAAEREADEARARATRVAAHVDAATTLLAAAHDARQLAADRAAAMTLFDAGDAARAEAAWAGVRRRSGELDASYALASQELEHALVIDPARDDVRRRLAEILDHRARLTDELHDRTQLDELLRRLALYDTRGEFVSRWTAKATLAIDVRPHGARLAIARISQDGPRRVEQPPVALGASPMTTQVAVGDHVVIAAIEGREIRYPVRVRAAERLAIEATVPGQLPAGYVYIPAGRFLVGTADEGARTGFLSTVPLHEARTNAYLIAIHETTFAEWIAFLEALPAAERERRRPRPGAQSLTGQVDLRRVGGRWELKMQPTTHLYTARQGEPLHYLDRATRADQDWTRFPVAGVTLEDVAAYTRWLSTTGRVPGARPCTELEWERAARGADDREFPHGDLLQADEANYDETYGKQPRAFGLDEIGAHPASRSPFGLHDMVGNVFELTTGVLSADAAAARGGAYYFGALTGRSTNRWTLDPTLRSSQLGVRVCADPQM